MLTALVLAWALVRGAHPVGVAAVGLAVWRPVWFLAAVGCWAVFAHWRAGRRSDTTEEAAFLQGMAAELASGASLRTALAAAADRAPGLALAPVVRLAVAGRPAPEMARALRAALPVTGRLAGPALRVAAATGGRSAATFAGLAVRALEIGRAARERRVATAQARLSAWILAGAPLGLLVVMTVTGRIGVFWEFGPPGLALLVTGVTLVLFGVGVVWWMLREEAP